MTANDLQATAAKIKVFDKEYECKPIRMSHRLIIAKLQPFFDQIASVGNGDSVTMSGKEILELESELDNLITSLIPGLQGVTLDVEDIADVLSQVMESMLPNESKELKEAKVEVNKDPKAPKPEIG